MSKIRTLGHLQDCLDKGFAWRLKEISTLKTSSGGSSSLAKNTIIRAGLPLVYAHWEGFIKQASQDYLTFVSGQRLKYENLTSCFVVFGVRKQLANLIETRKSSINIEAVNFFRDQLSSRADLVLSDAIRTKSNLNSEVFEDIARSIGVDVRTYDAYYNLIDESLLKRRNGIAHGEYLDLSPGDFRTLADEVIALLRMFKGDIENLASTEAYKAALVRTG